MRKKDFGWALDQLRCGHKVFREGWNGNHMWLMIQEPDDYGAMNRPFIYIHGAQGQQVPWQASQEDMLSEDWEFVDDR